MDYASARDVFFQPRPDAAPAGTDAWTSPARRLRDAIEPIAMVCIWAAPAYAEYEKLGLDFLSGYARQRGSALGDADGTAVAAAFGVFEPGLIGQLWDAGKQAASLEQIRRARTDGSAAALHEILGDAPGAGQLADRLRAAADAAGVAARPLFAGERAQPRPADDLAALWHACTTLRELRGDSHLAACLAAGIGGLESNILTELWVGWAALEYTGTRGWSPEAMRAALDRLTSAGLLADNALTDAGHALREGIETATDRAVQPAVDALGADLDGLVQTIGAWSDQVVASGWFPPDPYKRAAG